MAGASENARLSALAEGLQRLVAREFGQDFRVSGLAEMIDGHAGLTFGFEVLGRDGQLVKAYVLKLAPVGVTRRGNTDVYRQAPLLRGLHAAGLPVPDVPFASAEEDLLGTPFIVMEKLPGRVFVAWEPHASFSRETEAVRPLWLQAARLLARIHTVDWQKILGRWEPPRSLREELDRWSPVLRHAKDPTWGEEGPVLHEAGETLHALLTEGFPDERPIGVVHGDFQPGNILYQDGEAMGVIDWELASIGAQGADLGWLLMMCDPAAWHPGWRPVTPVRREELIETYRAEGGPAFLNLDWYQALSQYRLACIACLNVKLHRSGKRPDALWERFAPSVSSLFLRGQELARRAIAR
jgi:aminoglycoside phosphotransferase (APT) family kinase protein